MERPSQGGAFLCPMWTWSATCMRKLSPACGSCKRWCSPPDISKAKGKAVHHVLFEVSQYWQVISLYWIWLRQCTRRSGEACEDSPDFSMANWPWHDLAWRYMLGIAWIVSDSLYHFHSSVQHQRWSHYCKPEAYRQTLEDATVEACHNEQSREGGHKLGTAGAWCVCCSGETPVRMTSLKPWVPCMSLWQFYITKINMPSYAHII